MSTVKRWALVTAGVSAALITMTGCSDNSSPKSGSTAASSGSASGQASTASSSQAMPSGVGTYKAGDAHVGVVINGVTQIFPVALKWDGQALNNVDQPDAQGQFSAVKAGMRFVPDKLTKSVRVAWLNDTGVVALATAPACSSSCQPQTAPANATYLVVQAQAADRFEVVDGATIQVQLTKANTPANMRKNLATATSVPQ